MAYTGLDETAEYDLGAGLLQFDEVTGGGFDYEEGGVDHHDGVAGQDFVTRPMIIPVGSADTFLATQDLLDMCIRATYDALPASVDVIQGGVLANAVGARIQTDCIMDSVEIGCEENGAVTVNYNWKSMTDEYTTIAAAATPKSRILYFYWHMGDVEFGGLNYKCQSFTATLKNNIQAWCSLDAKIADAQRLPEELKVGNMEVTLSAVFRSPTGYDLTADLPLRLGFMFTATNENGDVFTLDLTGGNALSISSCPVPIEASADEVTWQIEAEADHNDLLVWDAAIV